MEKQIFLKDFNRGKNAEINKIIEIFKCISVSKEKIHCDFIFNVSQQIISKGLKLLQKNTDVEIICLPMNDKKICCNINVDLENIAIVLQFIKTYEICATFSTNEIKINLNDNDGDFVIIDSKNEKYKIIKNLL